MGGVNGLCRLAGASPSLRGATRRSNPYLDTGMDGLLRFARNDAEGRLCKHTVVSREGGGSSTPRPIGSIIDVSGILDHPPSRVMTTEYADTISRLEKPEACMSSAPRNQRAQGRPGARCTRGLACNCAQRTRTRAYRFSGNTPAFPAQWLYGLLRALPSERLFCHCHPREARFPGT